jgi:phosphatidylserine/phosphatidylglycerophosphate/cardiolipin synthase-like enzyme
MIRSQKDGILLLMFNPGPRGSFLMTSSISPRRVASIMTPTLNQDPGTAKNPVTLFNRGERIDAIADVALPPKIPGPFAYWHEELLKLPRIFAMVHSKVIVIDPYGEKPMVMTGSHNMGPKASGVNDENLLLIEGDGDLASQYAGHIMQVYSQYRLRQSVQTQQGKPTWEGLADDDEWQIGARGSNPAGDKRRVR